MFWVPCGISPLPVSLKALAGSPGLGVQGPGFKFQLRTSGENLGLSRLHLPQAHEDGPTTAGEEMGQKKAMCRANVANVPKLTLLPVWDMSSLG